MNNRLRIDYKNIIILSFLCFVVNDCRDGVYSKCELFVYSKVFKYKDGKRSKAEIDSVIVEVEDTIPKIILNNLNNVIDEKFVPGCLDGLGRSSFFKFSKNNSELFRVYFTDCENFERGYVVLKDKGYPIRIENKVQSEILFRLVDSLRCKLMGGKFVHEYEQVL